MLLKAISIESGCANLLFGVIEQVCLVTAFEYPVNLVARVWKAEAIAGVLKSSDAGAGGQVVAQSMRLVDEQDVIPILLGYVAGGQDVAGL